MTVWATHSSDCPGAGVSGKPTLCRCERLTGVEDVRLEDDVYVVEFHDGKFPRKIPARLVGRIWKVADFDE
jgi:hypothetical protein